MSNNYFHIKFELLFSDGATQLIDIDSNTIEKISNMSFRMNEIYMNSGILSTEAKEEIDIINNEVSEEYKRFTDYREIAYFIISYLNEKGKIDDEILDSANVLLERHYSREESEEQREMRFSHVSNRFSKTIFLKMSEGIDIDRISNISIKLDNCYKQNSINYKNKGIIGPDIKFCCKFMPRYFLFNHMANIPDLRKRSIIRYAKESYMYYLNVTSNNIFSYILRRLKYQIFGI